MHRNTEKIIGNIYSGNQKLYFLCVLVGLLTGTTVYLYRLLLQNIDKFRESYFYNVNLGQPLELFKVWVIFILIGLLINYLYLKFPTTGGSGIPQVKGLILGKIDYKNWFPEFLVKFFTGAIGIGAGLSFGRAGPSIQFGSYVGYGVSKLSKRDMIDRDYLITSGASAGLAGVFGAPLAGVMFSIEEVHKYLNAKLLTCIFVASVASNFVVRLLFGNGTSFNVLVDSSLNIDYTLQFCLYILLGVIIAILGKIFTFILVKSIAIFNKIKFGRSIKVSFVMSLSFVLCFVFPEITVGGQALTEHLGEFKTTITTLIIIFIIKLLFTSISYATGFSGGLFFPILVLGALIGKIFGELVNQVSFLGTNFVLHCVILGMAAYFVSIVRAPITGTVLILETTGNFQLLFAMITVSAVAFLITEILGQMPISEILYGNMKKEKEETETLHVKKTVIKIPVMRESLLEDKIISEIEWPKDVLVIAIERNGVEIIPKGQTLIERGDVLLLLLPENLIFEIKEHFIGKGQLR